MGKHKEVIERLADGNIVRSKAGEGVKFPARPESSNNIRHAVLLRLAQAGSGDNTGVDVEGLQCVVFKPFAVRCTSFNGYFYESAERNFGLN